MNLEDNVKKAMFIFVNNVIKDHDILVKSSKYKILDKHNISDILSEVDDLIEVIHFGNSRLLKLK